jgi:hypothetical protein
MKPTDINPLRPTQVAAQEQESSQIRTDKHQPPDFPDSMSTAKDDPRLSEFTPSKPKLPELRAIYAVMKARDTSQATLGLNADGLEIAQNDLKSTLTERAEKLKEACERAQSAGVWDTLRRVGAMILGAVSAFLGLSLFATGGSTLLGGALVVAGVLSLANLAFADAGIWDWMAEKIAGDNEEKKKKIAFLIPCVLGVLACGLGLASLGALGMWGALPAMPRALVVVQTAANILTIAGTAGGQISQARVAMSQADLQELQNKMSRNQHEVDRLSENIELIMEQETEMTRMAKSLLNLSIQTKQALLV